MIRAWLRNIVVALSCAVAAFTFRLPLDLYALGLSNIEGRLAIPLTTESVGVDTAVLQKAFRSHEPIEVRVLNPWTFMFSFSSEICPDTDRGWT